MAITETNDKKRAQNPSIREPLCEVKTSIVGFIALYALITIGFVAIGPKLFSSTWVSSSDFHSCIEITSSFIAIIAAIACLMHYFGFKSRFYLICGLGFFICGGEDFIHGLLSFTRLFSDVEADLSRFVPGTYVAGRSAFAIFIILAAVLGDRSLAVKNIRKETFLFSSLAFIVGGLMTAIAIMLPLPQFIYPERLISRPVDFVSAVLFAIAFAVVLRRYLRRRSIFSGFLLACILLNLGGQIYMSFSKQLFDAFFDTAHWANIMSYCMPVLGIAVQAREEMKKSKRELTARTQSERELQLHRDHLEQLVEERTHELAERVKELDCLYRVSRLATEVEKSMGDIFTETVDLIPPSWQYPEITCARILVNGQEFMTDNFEETKWKQSADIVVSEGKIGSVEVYYLQDKPVIEEGPFLKEERHLIDALGKQLGIIFERKQAEERLQEAELRLRLALLVSNMGTWKWDIISNQDTRDAAFNKMLGLEEKDTTQPVEDFVGLVHPEDRPSVEAEIQRSIKEHTAYKVDFRIIRPNGEIRWLSDRGEPFYDNAGKASFMTGAVADITERKKAEEKLKEQNKFLNSVLESLTHPFYVIDVNNYTVKMANAAANMGELSEKSTCYALTHKQDKPCAGEHLCPLEEVKKTKKPVFVEHVHYDKDGHERIVEVHGYPILDSEGNVAQMIEYTLDITERKQAEQMLEVSNRELALAVNKLEEANRELKDFVYIASHDLREPMRKISSFGELLKDSLEDSLADNDQENLEFMIDGADRMTAMIDGLLTYSRIATRAVAFGTADLNEIVEQLEQVELAELLEETGAAIEVPQQLPKVQADPVQIRQLLQNLVINGIRYRREGIQPRVVIRAEQIADGEVKVEVEDNGIGIAKEYREDVFKMFKRLHARQKYEGTGIGLAVCKRIVERHNGQIGVESEAGAGSTFWFTLPVSESLKAEQTKPVSSLET